MSGRRDYVGIKKARCTKGPATAPYGREGERNLVLGAARCSKMADVYVYK